MVVDLPLDNAKIPDPATQAKRAAVDLVLHVMFVATLTAPAIHHCGNGGQKIYRLLVSIEYSFQ